MFVPISSKKMFRFEFWPFWLFYLPAYFYYVYLALRAGSPFYFTALNKSMDYSGAFSSKKSSYLPHLPSTLTPKMVLINRLDSIEKIRNSLRIIKINYPLIAKPDQGERGRGVEFLIDEDSLRHYLIDSKHQNILLQEYVKYPIELGILYYKMPNNKEGISSIVKKQFCMLEGDGNQKLFQLARRNVRINHRLGTLKSKYKAIWNKVIPKGETILAEPIGSHNRGTMFLDARDLLSPTLLRMVRSWAENIPDFDYGRFDIKINNWSALETGQNIKILEVNGVNSEPAHIYDPEYSLIKAYRDIFFHMHIIYKISVQKMKGNVSSPLSFVDFLRGVRSHFKKDAILV